MKKKGPKRKLALVMSGGGMRCVYGVGVLTALVEEYGLTKPDIIVASSGSVANAAYYLSGQYRSTIAAWLALLGDKKFISFRRRKVIDIDYLVDDIFKKRFPFDFTELRRSRTEFFLATTRMTDGETIYLKLPRTKTIYEHLRAAKAIPGVYGKEVRIGKASYIDGDFGTNTDDLVRKAVAVGATHILVIENNLGVDESQARRMILNVLYYQKTITKKTGVARAILREMKKTSTFQKGNLQSLVISPSRPLGVSILSTNKLALRKGFNLGYADAAKNTELAKLLA